MESGKDPSNSAAAAPRIIQSLTLPHIGETVPGPLHTIVTDPDGNLYYSDEINHSVVSLNAEGSIRWHKMKRGNAPGEFWYPRGLSLGWIQSRGKTLRCLAIADAWNHRVQFLDLEGNVLSGWTHAKEIPFGEVADVRFIEENVGDENDHSVAGFWTVLDRGNHRLCRLTLDGNFLDQTGRGFPRHLEKRWAVPEFFFSKDKKDLRPLSDAPPFDFMYYPERIIGNSVDSLFVCEVDSRRLKQVIPPHILPVCIDDSDRLKWIAADASGLLSWDRDNGRLIRFSSLDHEREEVKIPGHPVSSNRSSDEYWMQTEESIGVWKWHVDEGRDVCGRSELYPWILQSMEKEINQFDWPAVQKSVGTCLVHVDEEIKLADTILAMSEKDLYPQFMDGMSGHAHEFTVKCTWFSQGVCESLHHWCLGQLERQITQYPENTASEMAADFDSSLKELTHPIVSRIHDIQKRVDNLGERLNSLSADRSGDSPLPDSWTKVAAIAKSNLEFAGRWIAGWSGIAV